MTETAGPGHGHDGLPDAELRALAAHAPLPELMARAGLCRDAGHGNLVSYSRKVFVPLTRLCRDVCHYCTFATRPSALPWAYLLPDEVLAIARAGARAGCHEVLFTLGDKPELRWPEARAALDQLGFASTTDYVVEMCRRVLEETGLLPHVNAGVLEADELLRLREVSASQGLMLESSAQRLCERGGPHFGSPDKEPRARMAMIDQAGALAIPFTSGLLIGIGETPQERVDALLMLRDSHRRHGHLQEIIIQNFAPKPGTRMARVPAATSEDLLRTVALARLAFGAGMNIQAPPNLTVRERHRLLEAGINDWGGVSPVTPDHVNPEAPWPEIEALRAETAAAGRILVERLPSYPAYCREVDRWHTPAVARAVRERADTQGYARSDTWLTGRSVTPPEPQVLPKRAAGSFEALLARLEAGGDCGEDQLMRLFAARADEVDMVCAAADARRHQLAGDTVRYVVNRNINYTNVCHHGCRFCAFSKGRGHDDLRGVPYLLSDGELARRVSEAWDRGATEVCLQGGIHPDFTGATYLRIVEIVKEAQPRMHVHAFSPLEISHGARTLGWPVARFIERLQQAGLGSLPGTAAEILDEEVRRVLCPDKVDTQQWLDVVAAAHATGLKTTATIMFGHIEAPKHWVRHLLAIRGLQERTGGFSEFVPLPFVSMEAPLYRRGQARPGPTWREIRLMHAVARLAFGERLPHIQTSWVKLGPEGAAHCLQGGANDLGGTLMNESISRAAGNEHGQELTPAAMDRLIERIGRKPVQRTTLYAETDAEQRRRAYGAAPLLAVVQTPWRRPRHAAA